MTEVESNIVFFNIIAGRKLKERLLHTVKESGGKLINVAYAQGTVKANYLQDFLGLVPEENKVLIMFLLHAHLAEKLFNLLNTEYDFDKANTGIAFTVPVEKISF